MLKNKEFIVILFKETQKPYKSHPESIQGYFWNIPKHFAMANGITVSFRKTLKNPYKSIKY